MLIARSTPECRLYMELHPCLCGEAEFDEDHFLESGEGGALVAVYQGSCTNCGLPRRFEFTLDPDLPPPPPAYGGPTPSAIICPGQFAIRADLAARSAPSDAVDTADRATAARAIRMLGEAVAAQSEILKFIPDGVDAVPIGAFTSVEGRDLYDEEPGRFREARLAAVLDVYREALGRYF